MVSRPSIPSDLVRQLMLDAGYRCSIPMCQVSTNLEIDHIVDWSIVKKHEYSNLIVLCPNHHAMKQAGSNPRVLNATALRIIKQNQIELAGRYGDVDRRVIEYFIRESDARTVSLPGDFDILLMRLLDDGWLEKDFRGDGAVVVQFTDNDHEPDERNSVTVRQVYRLTKSGDAAVASVRNARGLHE